MKQISRYSRKLDAIRGMICQRKVVAGKKSCFLIC